jgi:hypothetical protein
MKGKGHVDTTQHNTEDYIASWGDQYFIEAAREMLLIWQNTLTSQAR